MFFLTLLERKRLQDGITVVSRMVTGRGQRVPLPRSVAAGRGQHVPPPRPLATGRGQHAPLPLPVATGRWQHAPPTTASGSSVDRVSDVFSNAVRKNTVTRWYHGGLNGFRVFPKFRWHEDGVQGLPKVVMFFLPLFERTRLQDGITVVS